MEPRGRNLRPVALIGAAALAPGILLGVIAALMAREAAWSAFLWTASVGLVCAGGAWIGAHLWFSRGLQPLRDAVEAFRAGEDGAIDVEGAPNEVRPVVEALREAADAGRAREGELQHALERNQILAREIHHRVQNNVQVLLSLVNRAQRRIEDPAARAAIAELGANMLPVTSAFSSVNPPDEALIVDGGAYLHRLAGQLQSALGGQARGVRLATEIELGALSLDDAVDLGLIVAEVFLSAHPGAAAQSPLTAHVTFSPPGAEKLGLLRASVTYDDDAISPRKLDAVLITELARQLRAKVEFPEKNCVAITWTAVPS